MPTNWTKAVSQDSFDGMNTKIGNSTDGETAATVFGKLLGMRNVVDWIKNTWTAAKAGLLDVAVSTRAPASTALSTATWTAARAGKLDNLDGKISEVGKSLNTYVVASDSVRKTFGARSITLTFYSNNDSYYNFMSAVMLNTFLVRSGMVRVKFLVMLNGPVGALVGLNLVNKLYRTYSVGSTGGSGNNHTSVDMMTKPAGTIRTGKEGWADIMIGEIGMRTSFSTVTVDVEVFPDVPLVIYALTRMLRHPQIPGSGKLEISKIEICYDEVTT